MSRRLAVLATLMPFVVVAAACGRATEKSGPASVEPNGSQASTASTDRQAASRAGGSPGRAVKGNPGKGVLAPANPAGDRAAGVQAGPAEPVLPPLPEPVPAQGRVIKNINLEIRINKGGFQRQFSRAGFVAEEFGGFVSSSQVSETDGKLASGTLTIRVPSNRFEAAVSRLKSFGKVTAEARSGQDVSKEFVDLQARLNQARNEEAFYLRLLEQAKSISDMIQVQSQLSNLQITIEQIQGQLNFLKDQTSLSTITVRLFEPGAPAVGRPVPLARAWKQAVQGFQSVVGAAVVALGWLTPLVLAALIGLGVSRWIRRHGRPLINQEKALPTKSG